MEGDSRRRGYGWAIAAGSCAALAAVSAKLFSSPFLKYGLVVLFNVTMWGCYVNSLKALSSLQATVTNFATNFLSSGLAGYFLFEEPLPSKVKAIYVKNLPENITSGKLKELFEHHGEITKVVLPPPKAGQSKKDFGFIHFAERSSALKAVKGTEKYEMDGHVIEATIAKPQSDRKIDLDPNSSKPGLLPSYSPYPGYGYSSDPYGAYSSGYGAAGFGQPMIYGRGPMPPGMRMVPMMLPDGRLGYVLQQPGGQSSQPPPPRRGDRSGGPSEGGSRGAEGNRGRRYHPY